MTNLEALEAEAIHILREVVAEFRNPVMLYSIGKDSSVLAHLARKAFAPGKPPFPLLHVDTTWKFRDMYAFRERFARDYGFELLVWTNPDGKAKNVNPFDYGSNVYTTIMKTHALVQALFHLEQLVALALQHLADELEANLATLARLAMLVA